MSKKKLRVALAQLNFYVGDIQGNLLKSIDAAHIAREQMGADIIVFPELNLTGYPPEDLLLRKSFIAAANEALNEFKERVKNIHCVVSHPHATSHGLYNSSSLIYNGTILGRYAKQFLPNYGVFDEDRYFIPGNSACVIPINGVPVGIIVCEDLWNPAPIQQAANLGARLILVPNASPFEIDKHEQRHAILAKRAKSANLPIVYVNCVGEQDELIFDGGSMVVDEAGKICQFAGFCNEIILPTDFEISTADALILNDPEFSIPSEEQRIYDCLVLGVRDYLTKNHFPGALVGVSGGIDSALTLAIAADALGKDHVEAILMPSRYTADMSNEDAIALAENLGVKHTTISIEPAYQSFLDLLAPRFKDQKPDVTEENIQSRCRGLILMALSNKSGKMVLATGNRSEMAMGYATLYGDMCGGMAVLKDIPKTLVYRLAHYRNQISPVIPERTIERPPTAELAPNQKDEDTLPPYPVLDKILDLYLNQELGIDDILAQGFEEEVVRKVVKFINRNEYKRRQSAIGIRINNKAFGRDRRYPITSGFKG
ncbi:MAG: NAD+ synthase [Gammaproteobacteria bacterium]